MEVRAFKLPVNLNLQRTAAEAEVWVCMWGPPGARCRLMSAQKVSGSTPQMAEGPGSCPVHAFSQSLHSPPPPSSIGHPWFSDFGLGTHFHPSLPGLSMSRVPGMLLHPGPLGSLHLYYHCSRESGVGYHG